MILLTGIAGFIAMHTAQHLLDNGNQVLGIDNLNNYYDPILKQARLNVLMSHSNKPEFLQLDLAEPKALQTAITPFAGEITHIIHLAAQAGVRYSLESPRSYVSANISGMLEVLECCRVLPNLRHLVYASSSSVYGANRKLPFCSTDRTDHPVSLYAATKKSGEVIAESYSRLYGIPMTGLRFFTVYGPWGRPDMAYYQFARNIVEDKPIQIYNYGNMRRDFTFIGDVVDGLVSVLYAPPSVDPPHRIYNLGNHHSESLSYLIELLEGYIGKLAIKEFVPIQKGDMQDTFADISDAAHDFGFAPKTSLKEGLKVFVDWFHLYYYL
jgi:UDP-glucuronate 4-epimerase